MRSDRRSTPSREHPLGTDKFGRDVFSRILYGSRISLSIGLIGVFVSFLLGVLLGGMAGYFGGRIDMIISRIIEFLQSLPTIPLWMALSAALPPDWSAFTVYVGNSSRNLPLKGKIEYQQ